MEKKKNDKIIAIIALFVAVVGLSVGFAALSTTLTINGTGTVKTSSWDVHFANLETQTTGLAKEVTPPTLTATKIGDYEVNLQAPGDSIIYTFDIVNSGSYDAKISTITIPRPTCSWKPDDDSYNSYCAGVIDYFLTYVDNGSTVQENDTLNSGETKKAKLELIFREKVTGDMLPTEDMTISNLSIPITYVQA